MSIITEQGIRVPAQHPLREIDDLPSPKGVPFFGSALQLRSQRIHAQVEAWGRQYGDLFRLQIGRRSLLVLSDHELIGEILRDRPDGFRRNPLTERIGREIGLKPGVFSAEGDAWKRQRRMVMSGFDPSHINAYFEDLVKVCARLERRWARAAERGDAIDLQADLMLFTVDAVSGLAFGVDINTLESDDEVIQKHLDRIFPTLRRRLFAAFPTWRWLPTPADRALERSVKVVHDAISGFIDQARKRLEDPSRRANPKNLLEVLIVAAESSETSATDDEISGNVMTMLLAGEDTTANTLAWMIYLLHRSPSALAKVRKEIDNLARTPASWKMETFAQAKYLDACANETMRLKPVAPFMVLQALRERVLRDVRVPEGTLLWLVMRGDSVDEKYFQDAQVFRPERWLDGKPQRSASSPSRVAMPFGAGPRVCPGRHLAMLEMKMALTTVLGAFDIEDVSTPEGREPLEVFSFTMAPQGLSMKLKRRVTTG
jgi:cytochrome P450